MSARWCVLAHGAVDPDGVYGSTGVHAGCWARLGVAAPGTPASFRALFGRRDATFRRIDMPSRALVVAAAAAGIERHLDAAARTDTALVVATALGSLDTDRRFARTLAAGLPEGPLFAYTLPNVALGELALRHGLRGPSLCLSTRAASQAAARRAAAEFLASGEAPFALACSVDALAEPVAAHPACCHAQVELLAPV